MARSGGERGVIPLGEAYADVKLLMLTGTQGQQAKCLELRAATSLARLWQAQDKRQDAYELLAPVYEWFTGV